MKKTITAMILALSMILCLAACSSPDISGRYDLTTMQTGGITISVSGIKDAETEMYLQLNADGSGVMKIDEEVADMQWKDGKLWPVGEEDDKISFTVEDGTLTMVQGNQTLTFTKTE